MTAHPAQEQTNYALGPVNGNLVSISKTYELVTQEIVGEEPRLKMTGNGTIQFDVKTGIPVSVTYKLLVVENTTNITVRVPLSLPADC